MAHKSFISFKKEDKWYRDKLVEKFNSSDVIDKSLDRVIDSEDGDYIMKTIRNDYLKDSTVTVFLIGEHSSENEGKDILGRDINYFIQRELQASLYNGKGNTRNGIVGVVLPEMYERIYGKSYVCNSCGEEHSYIYLNDNTVIREFSENYYIKPHNGCLWSEEERYCVLVKWTDFYKEPEYYINKAYDKRFAEISKKLKIYNLR